MNKAVAFVFLALEVMLLFSACKASVPEETEPEDDEIPPISQTDEEKEIFPKTSSMEYEFITAEKTEFENGEIVFKVFDKNGKRVGEDYSYFRKAVNPENGERFICSFIAKTLQKPALEILYDENGEPYINTKTAGRYVFLDEYGNRLIEVELEEYSAWGVPEVNEWDAKSIVVGVADGFSYHYEKTAEEYVLVSKDGAFEEDWENGFTYHGYLYATGSAGTAAYGIKKDGRVILECVCSGITLYFGDRFVAETECKNGDEWQIKTVITDENGNIICDSLNFAHWVPLDEKRYIGVGGVKIGWCEYAETYDENGEPLPKGMWFIDRDGNRISERFEYIDLDYNLNKKVPWILNNASESPYVSAGTATVTYSDGRTENIDISQYCRNY